MPGASATFYQPPTTIPDDLTVVDDLFVGGDLDVDGATTLAALTLTGQLTLAAGADLTIPDDLTVVDDLALGGTLTIGGDAILDRLAADTLKTPGDLVVGPRAASTARLHVHAPDSDILRLERATQADDWLIGIGSAGGTDDSLVLRPSTNTSHFAIQPSDASTPLFTVATNTGNTAIGGSLDVAGFTTIGDGSTFAQAAIDGAAGQVREFYFMSGGVSRWILRVNTTAEGGANAGSDFQLLARSDAGAALSTPLTITRSTAKVLMAGELELDGALNHDGATAGFFGAAPIARPAGPAAVSDAPAIYSEAWGEEVENALNALRTALNAGGLGLVTTV